MCGIAGIVGPGVAPEKLAAVARMSVALARRGPDDHGIGSFGSAVLGHRRLAIFDLSENGRQPMTSLDGEVAVVFNGAIYNFHDLREQLRANGSVFSSATDTEVLLHGYQAWGMVEMVKRLRGMFAFALWDIRRRKLFLVRDRLGVKPLAYAVRGRQIAFASTVGALRQGGFAGPLNEESMLDVLRWGFVQEPRAIYRGIVKLAPATILEWCDGNIGQKRYWQAPSAAAASSRVGFSHAVAETERYLLDAVAVRLQADVPVGVLLSGGIDSSLVCWALAQLGADVTAYTIAVPGDASDETRGAIATAQRLRLRHRVIPIAAEGTEPLDEMLTAFDEPFASASALGMLQVSRAVRTQAKVLLTGDGGDDIFFWLSAPPPSVVKRAIVVATAGAERFSTTLVAARGAAQARRVAVRLRRGRAAGLFRADIRTRRISPAKLTRTTFQTESGRYPLERRVWHARLGRALGKF